MEDQEYLEASGWSINHNFEEVPASMLHKELWQPKLWGKWDYPDNIVVLEGRALVKSLKRIALTTFGHSIRQLLLVDNLSVALAFDRCRSRDYKLLKQIRRFCGYLLSRNIAASIRWVPSELNNSDEPSRYFSDEPSKLLTDSIPHGSHVGLKERKELEAPVGEAGQEIGSIPTSFGSSRSSGYPKEKGYSGLEPLSLKEALRSTKDHSGTFNLVDVFLKPTLTEKQRRQARSSSGSSTSSTQSQVERKSKKTSKTLERRIKRRARKIVDAGMEMQGGSSNTFLEHRAVKAESSAQYRLALEQFMDFSLPRGLEIDNAERVDRLLVDFLNKLYQEGHQAYKGDRVIAAFMHENPQYGRNGDRKIPRTWRAIKGFRKMCPGKSRKAYPLAVWAAMAIQMKEMKQLRMAIFLLMAVSSYSRPSELLRARVFSLVRPARGVTSSWSLLLSPEERAHSSKTGGYDTSILLDSPWLTNWGPKIFEVLKNGHPEEALWDFSYIEYSKVFKKVADSFDLDITPYQTRHSGPSIDRSRGYRSLQEVQKRGQWKSQKSVTRYEKSARLASTWEKIPQTLRFYCQECEDGLGEFLLGKRESPVFRPNAVGNT